MSHSLHHLYVHLVWATWDREPCLDADVREWLWPSIAEQARSVGCKHVVVGGIEDHVHVLADLPAAVAVATLAQRLKGASSAVAGKRLGQGVVRWQGGYGAFTFAKAQLPGLEAYVREQAAHHRSGKTMAELEPVLAREARLANEGLRHRGATRG